MTFQLIFMVLELSGVILALAASIWVVLRNFRTEMNLDNLDRACKALLENPESKLIAELKDIASSSVARSASAHSVAEACSEALSALNAKLASRWREEEKRAKKEIRNLPAAEPEIAEQETLFPALGNFPVTPAQTTKMRLVAKG